MRIKKVKLNGDGSEGLKVECSISKNVGENSYDVFRNDNHNQPIPMNIQESFNMLKIHLLKLCRFWDPEQDKHIDLKKWVLKVPTVLNEPYKRMRSLMDDLMVTGVTSNLENFVIVGKLKGGLCPGNINVISMNIPPDTDYPYYDEVIGIIEEIYEGASEYLAFRGIAQEQKEAVAEMINDDSKYNGQDQPEESLEDIAKIQERTGKVIPINEELDSNTDLELVSEFQDGGATAELGMPIPAQQ